MLLLTVFVTCVSFVFKKILNFRALWLTENQSRPLPSLQESLIHNIIHLGTLNYPNNISLFRRTLTHWVCLC